MESCVCKCEYVLVTWRIECKVCNVSGSMGVKTKMTTNT